MSPIVPSLGKCGLPLISRAKLLESLNPHMSKFSFLFECSGLICIQFLAYFFAGTKIISFFFLAVSVPQDRPFWGGRFYLRESLMVVILKKTKMLSYGVTSTGFVLRTRSADYDVPSLHLRRRVHPHPTGGDSYAHLPAAPVRDLTRRTTSPWMS